MKLQPASVHVLHAVINRSLRLAVRDKLILNNPARDVEDRPRPSKDRSKVAAQKHCWTADEARRVLTTAKDFGPQVSAFIALLLDIGCRKSEAVGLMWTDIDLDAATLVIARQLESRRGGEAPTWGPTKTGTSRTIQLGQETVTRLIAHRQAQNELKMKNRTAYTDYGLVFAKQPEDLTTPTAKLGQACPSLSERQFRAVVKTAGVRRIKVHGTRHTVATLLLQEGVPVQVVAQRLGHAQISMTLEVYAHALPDAQKDAAARLGALLTGS